MLNGQFPNNNMMMNNSNNQNNNNDFPDQSHIAQQFNQRNNMNQNMMMNNNMNNNMNMMNNMGNNMNMMNNNMGKMNNNMGMMNNNMGKGNMNNNMGIMNNNMGMMNNNGMVNNNMGINNNMNNMGMMNNNNMNMMNNMGMINNIRKMNTMNNIGMNNNMSKMNTMNNMQMMNNNMGMNNMALVRRNTNTFNINWFNNNYLPNNMNSQNYIFIMNMLHNQMLQRQYYQMMFQRRMFYQMQKNILERKRKMNEILDMNFNNNNNQNQQIQIENEEDDYVPNQALLDVIQEPNPPNQNQNNQNQNQNNPILPSELVSEVIADVMNLNPDLLSGLGNNLLGEWAQGERRGGRQYNPPNGWIGYGLNVLNKYDNGNNDWLACNGRPGEWCIAYHGACHGQTSDNVKKGIKSILETNLRPGGGQAYQSHDDANHPGQKVGKGVYCSPEPSVIDGYAGIMNINGHNYKAAFMLRVKPDRLRYSSSRPDYWVVNGDFSELRPYRLLIKPC